MRPKTSKAFGLSFFLSWLASAAPSPKHPKCKAVSSSPDWPSSDTWAALNSTLGGKLLAALPPAIVCDRSREQYSAQDCASVNKNWLLATFYDEDPISLQYPNWQNDACLPPLVYNGSNPCELQPFPKYTVNATDSEHVVQAVKFASEKNLRISVKNTGHDFLGRSTSPEFSIWTHNLKGIEFHSAFKPKGCDNSPATSAVTLGAGNQFADIYTATNAHDVIVVGGAEPSVGLGGWLTGGGHSPVGAMYGLGVDNVLEMQLVTPSGELLIINECQHEDLFWAMRGGGGSTFGVMVSATVKTHPNLPIANFTLSFSSTDKEATHNDNANFYSLLADMYSELVRWSDHYVNGYFSFGPSALLGQDGAGMAMVFGGYMHNHTVEQLDALMDPFVKKMNKAEGISGAFLSTGLPKMSEILGTDDAYTQAGYNVVMTSRLWPREALTDKETLVDYFKILESNGTEGLVVSGPAVRDFPDPGSTSVTPAWRRTYLHTTLAASWDYRNATQEAGIRSINTDVLGKALRDIAPDMGCYLNEADVYEPDPGQAFWGDNYARLLELKRSYDPNGTFWCLPCVGNEDWTMNENTGQLCRA